MNLAKLAALHSAAERRSRNITGEDEPVIHGKLRIRRINASIKGTIANENVL
jgi:hypothetical protein